MGQLYSFHQSLIQSNGENNNRTEEKKKNIDQEVTFGYEKPIYLVKEKDS